MRSLFGHCFLSALRQMPYLESLKDEDLQQIWDQGTEVRLHAGDILFHEGDTVEHLRLCLICGHVGCCDNSKNKHATQHFHTTEHPIIQSFQPDEDWQWCYVDQVFL